MRVVLGAVLALAMAGAARAAPPPDLAAALSYAYPQDLVADRAGDAIAWVVNDKGVRNVFVARAPDFRPRQVTHTTADDGQEITGIAFSPDGSRLVWVRGGDHDENWPAEGGLQPNPASAAEEPKVTIWTASTAGGEPVKVAEGDEPAISAKGVLAYVSNHQVFTAPLDGKGTPERLFFDRGHVSEPSWSPDGSRLAFVSARGDHAFIGVFTAKDRPIVYLAPSTDRDGEPRWSPDGTRIAFTRQQGLGGAPRSMLTESPEPWSIWVASADGGEGTRVWASGKALNDSWPDVDGEANLEWMAGDAITFLSEADGWPHLYAISARGGRATLLTPGAFMVEHVAKTADRTALLYAANTGGATADSERRHIFRVSLNGGRPVALTSGTTVDWSPVSLSEGRVAYIGSTPAAPSVRLAGPEPRDLQPQAATSPTWTIIPKPVTFTAPDGLTVHADLFETPGGPSKKPAVIFVHGGPPRQMLLGWHYMDYYTNGYAVNQYLAAHGFVVLSVNYRLGIGYGRAYQHPEHAGPAGAAEVQDVAAAGRWLQSRPDVDANRVGIWGGSYGGYLTAMALARNPEIFKAGVDLHGVHDWSRLMEKEVIPNLPKRYEKGDQDQAVKVAFESSPVADLSHWTAPVLLIQGDDDRNVDFSETVDLARRLEDRGIPFQELVLPNEIHGFLRHESWLTADAATVRFLEEKLGK